MCDEEIDPFAVMIGASGSTSEQRDVVLLDHLANLTEQVRRLAEIIRTSGIEVPVDIGTLGPASEEVCERLTRESFAREEASRNR